MQKRGQAAMEFLMTYGWAILAVLLSIAALAYFGVLNPSRFLPESCTLFPGLACKDVVVSYANSNITMIVTNGFGSAISVNDVKCLSCTGSPEVLIRTATGDLPPPQPIQEGDQVKITIKGINPGDVGSRFKSDVALTYSIGQTGIRHTRTGSIVSQVSESGTTSTSTSITTTTSTTATTTTSTSSTSTSSTVTTTTTTAPCTLNTASWDIISANQGQPVGMTIVTNNCIGQTMNFEVWEDDGIGDEAATVNPSPVSITINTVATTWTAEWQNDCAGVCNPPEWYFRAYIASNPSNEIFSPANLNTFSTSTTSTTSTSTTSTSTSTSTSISTTSSSTSTTSSSTTTISGGTLTFNPSEDARVDQASPTSNFGSALVIQVDGATGANRVSYLKFNVAGVTGPVISATLNVKTYAFAADTCQATSPYKCVRAYSVSDNSWTELGITWNNKPALGAMLSSLEDVPAQTTFYSLDVTSAITGDGTYSFALDQTPDIPNDYASFYSRDASGTTNDPYLQITYA